jgi:hypothetical protein
MNRTFIGHPRRLGRRPRRPWLLACAVATALLVAPASANAWSNTYCGVLLNSGTWCGDGSNHTYDSNEASYTGTGNVWVCERLLYADSSSVRGTPYCAYNYAPHNYGSTTATLFEAEVRHVTDSGARHTVWGYATA